VKRVLTFFPVLLCLLLEYSGQKRLLGLGLVVQGILLDWSEASAWPRLVVQVHPARGALSWVVVVL
jgi:hypothetical protein